METIEKYLEYEFISPCELEDHIYFSQLLQAEGIRTAIEAHRAAKPRCMGTLYWQFNDCWPVISWSGIDHEGEWKALQYFVRKAYQDVLPVILPSMDGIQVMMISDRNKKVRGKLKVTLMDFSGKKVLQMNRTLKLPPNASVSVLGMTIQELGIQPFSPNHLVHIQFLTKKQSYENIHYFAPLGKLALKPADLRIKVSSIPGGFEIEIKSDVLVKNVLPAMKYDSAHFSDKYFDILPGKARVIHCHTKLGQNDFLEQFHLKSFTDFCQDFAEN